jgi:hypothetical protein
MGFIAFYTEITNRIASGSIKNVFLFGDEFDQPAAPYVIVKSIAGGNRELLQIIVHVSLGMQDFLKEYIFRQLPALLKEPLRAEEKVITVRSTGAWLGPYVDEGDNTLAMSRDFYIPIIL